MADFKPRGAPVPTPYEDPYAGWDLIHRNAMTPAGVYQKGDDTAYGWAVPGMISEPANALYRLLDTPAGTMPNPQNEQNQHDALIGLLSLYGGNALKGMAGARGAARVAATLGDMEAPRAVSYGNMIDDALSNPALLRQMDDIKHAELNSQAKALYGRGIDELTGAQEAQLRGWSDPATLMSDTGQPNPVGAAVSGHGLPMDQASRMARAEQQGYHINEPVYHETAAGNKIRQFKPAYGTSVWFTTDKSTLGENGAAGTGQVIEAFLKHKKLAGWDEYDKYSTDQLIGMGYDGARLGKDIVMFSPKNIRSVNAAFDPAKADSSFLLASDTGKPSLLGAALAGYDPNWPFNK